MVQCPNTFSGSLCALDRKSLELIIRCIRSHVPVSLSVCLHLSLSFFLTHTHSQYSKQLFEPLWDLYVKWRFVWNTLGGRHIFRLEGPQATGQWQRRRQIHYMTEPNHHPAVSTKLHPKTRTNLRIHQIWGTTDHPCGKTMTNTTKN